MPGSLMMGRQAQGLDTSIDELMKQIEALSPEPDGEARTSPQGRPAAVHRGAPDTASGFLASTRDVQIGSYRVSAKPVGSGGHLIF